MRKRKVEIWDLLPLEANRAIDEMGYSLLVAHGYDVADADASKAKRHSLKEAMKARGEELRHASVVDPETGKILFWFELHRNGELVERSQAIQFVPVVKGEENGEGAN